MTMSKYVSDGVILGLCIAYSCHTRDGQWEAPCEEAVSRLRSHLEEREAFTAALVEALQPFAEPHAMGDNYVQFAPRLIEAARAAVAAATGSAP